MKKRFLAILLCLSVLLMACACAAETMEPPAVSETESKAPTPQFTLSEVNAESSKTEEPAAPSETAPAESEPQETISMEESEISLEPIQPVEPIQPIIPVKKETTLEKVFSFDIGLDGVMEYSFLFHDDPSTASIVVPGSLYTDGAGTFYHTDDSSILRLNDGAEFPFIAWAEVLDIEIHENDFYILKSNSTGLEGILYHYDVSGGFESPILKATYDKLPAGVLGWVNNAPVVFYQGKMYCVGEKQYSATQAPYAFTSIPENAVSIQKQDGTLTIMQGEYFNCYVPVVNSFGTVVVEKRKGNIDTIYTTVDSNGNTLARFMVDIERNANDISCKLDFNWYGDVLTVETYRSQSAFIGDKAFEDLLANQVFYDANGNAYFAAYYLDRCDIYSIDQGYSDAQLSGEAAEIKAGDSSVAPTSNASGSSASSVQYLDISRAEVKANALEMINLEWNILPGNLTPRAYEDDPEQLLELPVYLRGNNVPTAQTGIPYCKAGYNGADNFESEAALLLDDGTRQMTGNISSVTSHQDYTIGLDCMRFVGKALELPEALGLAPWQFKRYYIEAGYGHEVDTVEELEEMDIIISSGHAMFFQEVESETDKVKVYDVTSGEDIAKTRSRNTDILSENLANYGYRFYHMYSASGYNSTQHWTGCASCDDYNVYEPHTMELSESGHFQKCTGCDYTVVLTPHTFTYTYEDAGHVATCTDCGYSVTATHSMTYTDYDANGHIRSCSCGYSVPAAHTFSGDYVNNGSTHGRTCVCGYTETIAHTLSYHHNVDTHWRECSVCDYATAPVAHIFVNGRCRVCNALQIGSGPANIIVVPPEEDALLPVPEDQKAFL